MDGTISATIVCGVCAHAYPCAGVCTCGSQAVCVVYVCICNCVQVYVHVEASVYVCVVYVSMSIRVQVYVHVEARVCVWCMCACTFVCRSMCMWKPEENLWCLSLLLAYCLSTESLTEPEAHCSVYTGWHVSLGSASSSPLPMLG